MTTLLSWVVTYLMHSTLLILGVWIAARWIRSASLRDVLWKLALVGGLVTASVQLALPADQAQATRVWNADAGVWSEHERSLPAGAVPAAQRASTVNTTALPEEVAKPRFDVSTRSLALAAWAVIAALLVGRILLGRRRLLRKIVDRKQIVLGRDRELVDMLSDAVRSDKAVRLTQSDAIPSPIAMLGWEIVVPGQMFARLSEEQRRTILAHELAHLTRRDPAWLLLAEGLKALLFVQPLHWLVAAKLKETAEFLCDDAAVLQTGDRRALAETLAELASTMTEMPAPVAAMAEGGSNLVQRVRRVLHVDAAPELPLKTRWRLAVGLLPVAVVTLFAPGVAPARLASTLSEVLAPAEVKPTEAPRKGRKKVDSHYVAGRLEHTYDGPDGATRIEMDAKHAWISPEGEILRFDNASGFVRATYEAETGTPARVDVTPDANLAPQFRYSVDGRPKEWCDDARRLLLAAVRYKEIEDIPAARGSKRETATWNANVEETGTRDGVPLTIRIHAANVRYDAVTGVVDESRSGPLFVEELLGDRERRFRLDGSRATFTGDFSGTTAEDRRDWVERQLRRHTSSDDALIEYVRSRIQ